MAYFNSSNFALYKKSKNPEWCQNWGFWVRKTKFEFLAGKWRIQFLGIFGPFSGFWGVLNAKTTPKSEKNWNRVPRRGDLKIWHKLYHSCQEGQIANFPAKISKNLNFLPRFCLKIIFWVPKYICISKKLDFSFSRQKFKF